MSAVSSSVLENALARRFKGQVYSDTPSLEKYSFDASMYRVRPTVVACPLDAEDVMTCMNVANEYGVPVTARAAATNLVGSCLGKGIILDVFKNMKRIFGVEEAGGRHFVTLEPGVVYDTLASYLARYGLFLPPDPASREACTIGGNVALKASGPRAVKFGSMDDYLANLEFVTAEGTLVDTSRPESIPDHIKRGVLGLKERVSRDEETLRIFQSKQGMKIASGYNLTALLKHSRIEDIVTHLMVGSAGTLGIFTKLRMEVKETVSGRASSLIYFRDLPEAADAVQYIKAIGAVAIEILNWSSLQIIKKQRPQLDIPDEEAHMLLIEFLGEERFEQIKQLEKLIQDKGYRIHGQVRSETDPVKQNQLWAARNAMVPILSTYNPLLKPVAFVEDIGMTRENLANVVVELEKIFARYNLITGIYGHAGDGNLHLRPLVNLDNPKDVELLPRVIDEVYDVVLKYNGTLTSEHGIGRLRTMHLEKEWGKTVVGYMREIKEIFDPKGVLNPEVIFSDRKVDDELKYPIPYASEIDIACMDCGYCMSVCPISAIKGGEEGARSFLHLIRLKNEGHISPAEARQIDKALSFCLGCLRCKVRCPSKVDVCSMVEAERTKDPEAFSKTGPLMRLLTYDLDRLKTMARLVGSARPIYDNSVGRFFMELGSATLGGPLGISKWDRGRYLPKLRKNRIEDIAREWVKPLADAKMRVGIFVGCGSALLDDGIIEATVRILQKNRFEVVIPEQGCCGVPMSHYGFEREAMYNAKKAIDSFSQAQVGAIVTTCGSCAKGLKEYSQLLAQDEGYAQKAKEFSTMSYDVSEFLWSHPEDLGIEFNHKLGLRLAYHDPCHLVAAGVTEQPRQILRNIAEDFVEIAPGCCGGAGAYMVLHANESKQIFDLKAQSIRDNKPDYIVSSCPGCVIQIKDGLRRNELSADSLHIVHLLDRYYQLNDVYR